MHIQFRSLALSALLLSPTLALPAIAASTAVSPAVPAALGTGFSEKVLATGLEMPWEITLGPDKFLWLTERMGKRVSRIDLDTGMKSVALAVDEVFVGKQHEGLLGLALHPELGMGKDKDFVYVAYTYDSGTSGAVEDRRSKIVQYQWDAEAATLADPVDLVTGIPAGEDHNAGHIKFGPDGMLYSSEQGPSSDDEINLLVAANRYRDTAISADGSTIYVATDVEGRVRDTLTSGETDKLTNPGSILVFKYLNPVTN